MAKVVFAVANLDDDISDVSCKNPKCGKPTLKMVGRIGDKKIIECQSCFWKCITETKEGLIFRKGDEL